MDGPNRFIQRLLENRVEDVFKSITQQDHTADDEVHTEHDESLGLNLLPNFEVRTGYLEPIDLSKLPATPIASSELTSRTMSTVSLTEQEFDGNPVGKKDKERAMNNTLPKILPELQNLFNFGYERMMRDPTKKTPGVYVSEPIRNVCETFSDMLSIHQREGLGQIIEALKRQKFALLADEMGLGKTFEMIALAAHLSPHASGGEAPNDWPDAALEAREKYSSQHNPPLKTLSVERTQSKSILIVAPKAAIMSFEEAIKTSGIFSNSIDETSVLVWDSYASRNLTSDEISQYNLVLITHSELKALYKDMIRVKTDFELRRQGYLLRQGTKKSGGPIHLRSTRANPAIFRVLWFMVIVDEAHEMRNTTRQFYRACCTLHAMYRVVSTGTFVVNTVADLGSLLKFGRLGPFHPHENSWIFDGLFVPTVKDKVTGIPEPLSESRTNKISLIAKACGTRRFQGQMFEGEVIANQDWKVEQVVKVQLNEIEQDKQDELKDLWDIISRMRRMGPRNKGQGKLSRGQILAKMVECVQFLFHPEAISDAAYQDNVFAFNTHQEGLTRVERKAPVKVVAQFSNSPELRKAFRARVREYDEGGIVGYRSTVMKKLIEILKDHIGRGAVVYCEFIRGLDVARVGIEDDTNFEIFEFIGSTNDSDRKQTVLDFNSACLDPRRRPVLLLSGAGGSGLNLPDADVIVIVSGYWNFMRRVKPTYRIIRFGRDRPVKIFHIRAKRAIAKRLDALTASKG